MNTFTYTWDSDPKSVIVQAKNDTEAYTKVALYVLKKYQYNDISLKDMVGSIQEEGSLAEVIATL